jgi:SAM-dependent methyltransferase
MMAKSTGSGITRDASRFTHGHFYHAMYDPHQAEARGLIVGLVPGGSSVLDIACGTGELCFDLAAKRNCRVVGIDISSRMIEFAERRNRHESVRFHYGDATDLRGLGLGVFDYATAMFLLHELPRQSQVRVLDQALRVARNVVIVDSRVPLPWNAHGIALRMVEVSGGRDHYRLFADFLAGGGIEGALAEAGIKVAPAHRSVFWHGCREIVVVQGPQD